MERDEGLNVYLSEIDNAKPPPPMQEGESGEREVRAGLIRANLLLVVKIAQEQRTSSETSILDLISAGNIGLIKAVVRFDPSKEGELAIFASWWISQSIKREAAKFDKKFFPFFVPKPANQGTDGDLVLPA